MSNPREATPEPKASRLRVFQAADQILRSGRRPTVEAIRELLGGGSPNSVTAYIQDWYQELGERLNTTEKPLAGFPREAISLLGDIWRIAAADRPGGQVVVADDADRRVLEAERDSLSAQNKALEVLNQELQRHRASAERSLAEARALLSRREAALEDGRAQLTELEQLVANLSIELVVARARQYELRTVSLAKRLRGRLKKSAIKVAAKGLRIRTSKAKVSKTRSRRGARAQPSTAGGKRQRKSITSKKATRYKSR